MDKHIKCKHVSGRNVHRSLAVGLILQWLWSLLAKSDYVLKYKVIVNPE